MVDDGDWGATTCEAVQAGPKEFIASNCQMWLTKRIDLREPISALDQMIPWTQTVQLSKTVALNGIIGSNYLTVADDSIGLNVPFEPAVSAHQ